MKVHCDEGVATHIGPEPCAGVRKDAGEASVGEGIGQPLSLEIRDFPDADVVRRAEGNMIGCVIASIWSVRRGQRTWHVPKSFAREPGDPISDPTQLIAPVRIGKARSRSR